MRASLSILEDARATTRRGSRSPESRNEARDLSRAVVPIDGVFTSADRPFILAQPVLGVRPVRTRVFDFYRPTIRSVRPEPYYPVIATAHAGTALSELRALRHRATSAAYELWLSSQPVSDYIRRAMAIRSW